MRKLFNEKQEQFILDNYKNMQYKDIAKQLGGNFTATQITGWLHNNGINKPQRNSIFTKEQQKYIEENYLKMSYKEIGETIGFTERQIRGYINHNFENKNRVFNKRYFQYIDEPIKAYWLGFIYADGWIHKNVNDRNYEFGIQLQSCDKYALDKLNEEIGGVHNISFRHREHCICKSEKTSKTDSYVLRVYSKQFVNDLESHNILENKTYKSNFPKDIIDKYLFDFLRGYIDGDGCIYVNGESHHRCVSIASANCEILYYLSNVIKNKYEINSCIYRYVNDYGTNMYKIHFEANNGLKLLNLIYYNDDIFKLDRKYQKYLIYKSLGSPM